ncbi:MAG: glutathione S-transferase N-terminal domain-containing protein, partial [Gammaproteobacteria bacterium]
MSNSDLPVLYSFRRCPYAMRARMALVYSNVKVELREVDLKNKPDAFSAISPKATVPVLFINDDTILDESLDIIHWALKINDSDGWNDLTKDQVNLTELLITENDSSFKTQLDKYKYSQRFPEYSEMQYRLQGEKFLVKLNDLLKNTRYLVKDKLTYADIAIAPFIRQFANVD